MFTAHAASPTPRPYAAPLLPRPAAEADEDLGFNGWLASSLELKLGLLVQTLRIDPLDADWREVFAA